jgi:tetratricopeptide (TPR) repeat protein
VKNEKVFLIMSGSIGQDFASLMGDFAQVTSIYIYCVDTSEHERWASRHEKVRGIFTRIETLSNELKVDVNLRENALTPISVISPSSTTDLNELDSSFMYSQLLKEILLEDEYDEQQKKKLVDFCRPHYVENISELKKIDEFEQGYPHPSPIWWYTRECFLYRMLNKALRTQEIEEIIRLGFVVRDLHQHIEQLNSQQKHQQLFIVYRGQGMAQPEFNKINNSKGGLLAFNNFLSTSTDRQISLKFARRARDKSDLTTILFEIKVDLTRSITPFASLDKVSHFGDREEEILFSMHTIFRIEDITQIEPRLFQINLTLTNDNDQQLTALNEYIQEATRGQTRFRRLGSLMMAMAEFDKAEEVYTTLFDTTSEHDREERAFLHHQLGLINWEKRDLVSALSQFQQSLDIYLTFMSSNNPQLSPIYSNIGTVLQEQDDLDGALKHLKLALDINLHALQCNELNIDLHALQTHQLNIATQHNNIGLVLDKQGKYDEALTSYERVLEIELVHLPPRHRLLATTYNNIGRVHYNMGEYSKALFFCERALEIGHYSLPQNHPDLQLYWKNIAEIPKE